MPVVDMNDMVRHAYRHNYAVGAFPLVNLEVLQGIVAAAERCRSPVILGLEDTGDVLDFGILATAAECAAQRASVPMAIHLSRGRDVRAAVRAINEGCNGVAIDAPRRSPGDNLRLAREVTAMARSCGVPVEGRLGCTSRPDDVGAQSGGGGLAYTPVADARDYVERTGVDLLAVSVGHHGTRGKAKLDWTRLRQLNEVLGIPLSYDDASGLSDTQIRRLIGNGIAKIGWSSGLADAALRQVRARIKNPSATQYADAIRAVQDAVEQEAERYLLLSGAAGRAAEVLQRCRLWTLEEHVVTCEGEGLEHDSVDRVLSEGRRVLGAIPGVRAVSAGAALRRDGVCRYSWRVRFCHSAAVESYREHPDYVEFAARQSRPGWDLAAALQPAVPSASGLRPNTTRAVPASRLNGART